MDKILSAGKQIYLVGGCVRDLLLGRPIHDWDLCTSMLPEEMLHLFPKTIPTGLKHGTVTVLHEGISFEITTFRTESSYSDHRSPDRVRFSSRLEDDLCRRDFTVNAMAMDRSGAVTDLFGGQSDLAEKLIRCVGDPQKRYEEDALRILRCVRFSAQLGFRIDAATKSAMEAAAPLCRHLSAERIRDEVEKILCSDRPEALSDLISIGVADRFRINRELDWELLRSAPKDRGSRWCMLCLLNPSADLSALRLEKKLSNLANGVLSCRDMKEDSVSVKESVYLFGREAVAMYAELYCRNSIKSVLASGECMELRELAVSGKDFPQIRGVKLGNLLRSLLKHVWEYPEDNQKDLLIALSAQTSIPEL